VADRRLPLNADPLGGGKECEPSRRSRWRVCRSEAALPSGPRSRG